MSRILCSRAIVAACAFLITGVLFALVGCSDENGSAGRAVTTSVTQFGASSAASASGSATLLMYAGAASKPPAEEAIRLFEERTGIKIEATFGGSGQVLSQMRLAKKGDLYFPGSSDYMEKAKKDGDVIPETEAIITYLVPAINVQKGNPLNIQTLQDLTRTGLRVAIADPETVCVGLYAVEIIEKYLSTAQRTAFRQNLLNYTDSCEKTATVVSLGQVDAVIGWSVFERWNPEKIETVPLDAAQIPRIGYIPIAVSSYTEKRSAAERFVDFLKGEDGQAIFSKYGYFATSDQALAYVGEEKPVGGEYTLPPDWITN